MNLQDFIKLNSRSKLKLLLNNPDAISGFESNEIFSIVMSLDDKDRIKILHNVEFLRKYEIRKDINNIFDIFNSLSDENKREILLDRNFMEKDLHLMGWGVSLIVEGFQSDKIKLEMIEVYEFPDLLIADIVQSLKSEELKLKMMDKYNFKSSDNTRILKQLPDNTIITTIIEERYRLEVPDLSELLSTVSIDSIVGFLAEHKEFLIYHDIEPYYITRFYNKERQLDFVSRIEDIDLSLNEKRKILVTLDQTVKDQIDKTNFSEEYATAIEIKTSIDDATYGKIIPDYNKDLEIYHDLDELIYINPAHMSSEDKQKLLQLYEICPKIKIEDIALDGDLEIYRNLDKLIYANPINLSNKDKEKFLELCEICPEINIVDNLKLMPCTLDEYKNSEIWIESVLQGLKTEWTDIQKIAYIDNAIGKKIKSSADLYSEVYNSKEAQTIWKIINSETGVCWGISELEKYILSRIGIESEVVISNNKSHACLKLKNLELPNDNGELVKGDTILDPTWNLTANRYGSLPINFCRSYEEIRKNDISEENGKDFECHKNDEAFASATLNLNESNLRKIYTSIGVADKDGFFPIKKLEEKSKMIDDYNFPSEEAIKKQFQLLMNYYPEFAICQNETASILQSIILDGKNLRFNKCIVNRVYEKNDINKRPVLYVYIDLPGEDKKFYFADKATKAFVEMERQQFESSFECYEKDMEELGGHRPWENVEKAENLKGLNRKLDKIVADTGRGD